MNISASLYAADPLRLAEAVAAVTPHVASLHVDVMDGSFAPAFGLGEALVRRLVVDAAPPVDVHLMVERPGGWAVRFAALGARRVAFHVEAVPDPVSIAQAIRAEGARAYLALLPDTPLSRIPAPLEAFDGLLLLTAPPGGGRLDEAALARVDDLPKGCSVIVDGRIGPGHFDRLNSAGIELAVVGTSLFEGGDWANRARHLNQLAAI
jgi:ribulose-phosphate 3-epimerase